jgi:hypothetical protein
MYVVPTDVSWRLTETVTPTVKKLPTATPVFIPATATPTMVPDYAEINVPDFEHIVLIVLENEYLQNAMTDTSMPNLHRLARENTFLSNYSAITHPSLPNYFAMLSGSTQGITTNCFDCFIAGPNLTDEIEASGRTWKAYFEDMPSSCFLGNKKPYVQIFNPFIYFDTIRLDETRCQRSLVPLTDLEADLTSGHLANFIYIAPNVCHSGHDCSSAISDAWLGGIVAKLQASPALQHNSLIFITFDEGMQKDIPILTHGEVAAVLISPQARANFIDNTSYSHYSLLKTILSAWSLPLLGDTDLPSVNLIVEPWINEYGSIYPLALTHSP